MQPTQSLEMVNFYPRSPRGERRMTTATIRHSSYFYPRSPRGERPMLANLGEMEVLFLSTLPARGATKNSMRCRSKSSNFYPRSPRGERPRRPDLCHKEVYIFLSTLPARGATGQKNARPDFLPISIHAPREGSDNREYDADTLYWIISIHAPREGSDPAGGRQAHGG